MESIDSSPNWLKATSKFGAKKEDSPGGSECGEDISVSSSTGKSTTKGPYYSQKHKNTGIKYRSNNKKTLKNFGSVRSFRRRANTRLIQSFAAVESDDDATASHSGSLVDSSASSPHYLKATSSSQGKKMHSHLSPWHSESPFDSSDKNNLPILQSKSGSSKPLQTLSRNSSFKGLGFLVKKASFKARKTALKCSVASQDVSVDRATYSSTIKGSKFPEPVEIHHGGTESNKLSVMKVCRYHHCSLHGHHQGDHDPAPQPKRSLYRRKWSLKRQRSMRPKTESWHGAKQCSDMKKELQNIRIMASVESSNQEGISSGVAFSGVENKNVNSHAEIHVEPESNLVGDGYESISESGLIELAFGESSFPDRSYQENMNILRKYSYEEQDFGRMSFGLNGRCLKCSCHNQAQFMSIPRAGAEASRSESTSSGPENAYKDKILQNVVGSSSSFSKPEKECNDLIENASTLSCANGGLNDDHPATPITAEVTENNSALRTSMMRSSRSESTSSGPENAYKDEILQNVVGSSSSFSKPEKEFSDLIENASTLSCANSGLNEDHAAAPITAEVTENNCALRTSRTRSSRSESTSSGPDNAYKDEILQNVVGPSSPFGKPDNEFSDLIENASTLSCANSGLNEDHPATPITAEVTENNSTSYSPSDIRTSSHINSDEDRDVKTESTPDGDSIVDEALQDSVTNSPTHSGVKLQFSKRSHISMWHLIHQHMLTNTAVEPTGKPLEEAGGESSADGTNTLVAREISTSAPDVPDSRVEVENNQPENHDIEVRKLFAIKLVREAIEKILLPEVQDQASDDQSIASESTPRAELVENNQNQGFRQDDNGYSDADTGKANTASNPMEESHTIDEALCPEIGKTQKKAVSKSEKKAPKHWSNLKKWILLQRFIKALEKVRKFNLRKPELLPLNPDPEAEKVNLRRQTVDERKNAEEWMLDYALRQAVGQLAPTQKKKVSLLIKAFETVVPPQEEIHFRSTRLENGVRDISSTAGKTSKFLSEDPGPENVKSSPKAQISTLDDDATSRALESTHCPASHSDAVNLGNIIAFGTEREALPKSQGLQETAASNYIQEKVKDSGESSTQLDRNTHIKMWHMVYRHVVSDIAEKVGSRLLDGSEDHDGSEENKLPAVNRGNHSHDFPKLSDKSSNLRSSFTRSDVLRLIKDAVDGILLRDIQDDFSDIQSVMSESITDLDIPERNFGEIDGRNVSNEGEKAELQSEVSKKFELSRSKNWSKVKKLVLLKRSIRALEKARNLRTQTRELVPQMPDSEPEKIELRTQMMDERKKAEQWMLDYAVQHIVTKLTPARKKRVSMLVEAFEAVVPFPEM